MFTLNQKAFTTRKVGNSLSKYYGELTEIFCELDHRDKLVMNDPDEIAAYQKYIELLLLHIFLAWLDGDFEQVRGEILRKDLVPDLEECYAWVRQEAVCHTTLKGESGNFDTSAMVARQRSTQNLQDRSRPTILRRTLVLISQPTNALIAIRLVIPRVAALNLWDIQNGEIIIAISERRIPRKPLLQSLPK